jgi:hypothetical protein
MLKKQYVAFAMSLAMSITASAVAAAKFSPAFLFRNEVKQQNYSSSSVLLVRKKRSWSSVFLVQAK